MNQELPRFQQIDVTSHHEAGHACVMAKCGLPIKRFIRFKNLTAQIETDTAFAIPEDPRLALESYYFRLLAIKASIYSQHLSRFNNKNEVRKSFIDDNVQLAKLIRLVYEDSEPRWLGDRPSFEEFANEIIDLLDAELEDAYKDASYKKCVRMVAQAFSKTFEMAGKTVEKLVTAEWDRAGVTMSFKRADDFIEICLRLKRATATTIVSTVDGITEEQPT